LSALARGTLRPAPASPYNGDIGPHRRFTWVRVRLGDVKAIKNSLGGTVNDVVLATVTGGLRRHLHSRGVSTQDLTLRAMVPVSVRSDPEQGALGNRVAAMMAPLPVWCENPNVRLDVVRDSMRNLKSSGQAVGAEVLTRIAGFAPPTIMAQATRIGARQRAFNLFVMDGEPVVVVASGRHRIDRDKVCLALDCAEGRQATPEEVRAATGFPIGGVPPIGHNLPVIFDTALLDYERIYAAGGDPNTLF